MTDKTTKKDTAAKVIFTVIGVVIIGLLVALIVTQQQDKDTDDSDQNTMSDHRSDDSAKDGDSQKSEDNNTDGDSVSKEEAEKIAIDKFGGTVKETESDDYNGSPAWEVEIRDSNDGRIEVKVDKKTGKILNEEKDD